MAIEQLGAPAVPSVMGRAPAAARARRGSAWHTRLGLSAWCGLSILLIAALAGVFAPWLAPFGYDDQDLARSLQAPVLVGGAWNNPAGTDQLGRDLLSRLIYGARASMLLASTAVLFAATVGILIGLLSGYVGGRLDAITMRVADVQLSFPYLLFAIAFMALLGTHIVNLVVVLVLRSWVVYTRLVRASVLSINERDFMTAATALGAGDWRILFRHVMPNVLAPVIVVSTLQIAELIIVESSLSFLGLGVQPPVPSWGSMVSQGREYISSAWWLATFPGLAILLTVLGANLFGDALRDALDPRLRRS
jgi:peptide/nickel transport system permease protein